MATGVLPSAARHPRRPLVGLRHTPGRLALAVFRLPLWLYHRGMGWTLGRVFLMLVHIGRKTGRTHDMAAMVLADDPDTGEVVICSAWGPQADWLHNLHAGPAKTVCIARDRFTPQRRFLNDDEAVEVAVAFRQRHPRRLRLITTILGWGDLRSDAAVREFVKGHPFVALRPAHSPHPAPQKASGAS